MLACWVLVVDSFLWFSSGLGLGLAVCGLQWFRLFAIGGFMWAGCCSSVCALGV